MNDRDWSLKTKELQGCKCAFCGSTKYLNSHHVVPKQVKKFRFDLRNCVVLCAKHHRFSFEMSAHQASFAFLLWFMKERKEQFEYLRDNL